MNTVIVNPYRLRQVLHAHAIGQSDLRQNVLQDNGQPMSKSGMSKLICHAEWPVASSREAMKRQVEEYLTRRGVPPEDLAVIWDRTHAVGASEPTPEPTHFTDLPESAMLSAAAREHFRLARHPFKDDVQSSDDVYLSADQRYIRESMHYAAKHGGFIAVVGESGSGKSTLRRDLIERLRRDNESIVVIQPKVVDKEALTSAHICEAIIADLSTELPKLSLEAKSRQVERILAGSARAGNRHVLLIEEAHDISVKTLKLLKRFWELEDGFRKLLGIILVGQPELGRRLDERVNWEAREVIRRCEVAKLNSLNGNLEEYLAFKFGRVGKQLDEIFEPDAFDAMRERLTIRKVRSSEILSQLYPLVVQNLVTAALNTAAENGFPKVNRQLVLGA